MTVKIEETSHMTAWLTSNDRIHLDIDIGNWLNVSEKDRAYVIALVEMFRAGSESGIEKVASSAAQNHMEYLERAKRETEAQA